MITEAYCSQEVIELLKQKFYPFGFNKWADQNTAILITHQSATAWLREEKGFSIEPYVFAGNKYAYCICRCDTGLEIFSAGYYGEEPFKSWEDATEHALFYTLQNLI